MDADRFETYANALLERVAQLQATASQEILQVQAALSDPTLVSGPGPAQADVLAACVKLEVALAGTAAGSLPGVLDRQARLAPLVADALTLREKAVAIGEDKAMEAVNALSASMDVILYGAPDAKAEQAFLQAYAGLCKQMAPITAATLRSSQVQWPSFRRDKSRRWGWAFDYKAPHVGRFLHCLLFIAVLAAAAVALMKSANGDAFLAMHDAITCEEEIVSRQAQRLSGGAKGGARQDGRASGLATGLASQRCSRKPDALASAQRRLDDAQQDIGKLEGHLQVLADLRKPAQEGLERSIGSLCEYGQWNVCGLDYRNSPEAARVILDRTREIFLPLLLGLLGASCYVLKTMSAEIRAQTFAPGSALQHLVWLSVGSLAGIVAGWLITPEEGALNPIPASALAFLAGYGSDLVFASADRIIGSLTSRTGVPRP